MGGLGGNGMSTVYQLYKEVVMGRFHKEKWMKKYVSVKWDFVRRIDLSN